MGHEMGSHKRVPQLQCEKLRDSVVSIVDRYPKPYTKHSYRICYQESMGIIRAEISVIDRAFQSRDTVVYAHTV